MADHVSWPSLLKPSHLRDPIALLHYQRSALQYFNGLIDSEIHLMQF
jgi:hypothetical protein